MTRISSSQRNLNPLFDQIASARSDAAASAASAGGGTAFGSLLARAGSDTSAKGTTQDSGASTNASDDSSSATKANTTGSQGDFTDAASALFAALSGNDQSAAAVTSNTGGSSAPGQVPLAMLLSLANMNAFQTTNEATGDKSGLGKNDLNSLSSLRAGQKPGLTSLFAAKHPGSTTPQPAKATSSEAADLSASAQVTVATVFAPLVLPNALTQQAPRKEAAPAGAGSNSASAQSLAAIGWSPSEAQSPSDATQSSAETMRSDPFADLTGSDKSNSQSINLTVSSTQAQTHFAPVQTLSPTQQIFDFVALTGGVSSLSDSSAGADAATASTPTSDPASSTTSVATSPVKTLTLALEPDGLGSVTIKMRLVNSGLELQVEAEKSATTSLIEKDKDSLSDKLQSLGYSVDSLVVKTVASSQGSDLNPSNDQATTGQGQQGANDASASGSSQNGGRNANDQSAAQNGGQSGDGFLKETSPDLASSRAIGDGVYV